MKRAPNARRPIPLSPEHDPSLWRNLAGERGKSSRADAVSDVRWLASLLLPLPAESVAAEDALGLYISRLLGSGPIRFGVAERVADPAIDDLGGDRLSTGPSGEFVRFRTSAPIASSPADPVRETGGTSNLEERERESILPTWGWVSVGAGALFFLLGLLVVANKGYASGYVEMVIGAGLVALPFLLTAKEKREQRARRDRERLERQEDERKLQEIAGAYLERVRGLGSAGDESGLEAVRAAREGKDIPYEHMQQPARAAALRMAFDALARWDARVPGGGVSAAIDRAALAMGLSDADRRAVRLATFQKAWWHQLADDRLSPPHRARLEELRESLRITPEDAEVEARAAAEFDRLRGITPKALPRPECPFRLRPLEVCVHIARAKATEPNSGRLRIPGRTRVAEEPWDDGPEEELVITTQRVLLGRGKSLELDVRRIYDLEAHIDLDILAITIGGGKRSRRYYLRLGDPIVTGALALLAAAAPLKPKGLV